MSANATDSVAREFWSARLARWHRQLVAAGVTAADASSLLYGVDSSRLARAIVAAAGRQPQLAGVARARKAEVRRAA